jgi:hypothetical protein
MTLNDLMIIANESIGDDLLAGYWDFQKHEAIRTEDGNYVMEPEDGRADGLVRFMMIELIETYDEEINDEEQLTEAQRVTEMARNQCERLATAFWMKSDQGRAGHGGFGITR